MKINKVEHVSNVFKREKKKERLFNKELKNLEKQFIKDYNRGEVGGYLRTRYNDNVDLYKARDILDKKYGRYGIAFKKEEAEYGVPACLSWVEVI